jgi:hypothetical protein
MAAVVGKPGMVADRERTAEVLLPELNSQIIAVGRRRELVEPGNWLVAGDAIPNYTLVVVCDHSYDTSILHAAIQNTFKNRELCIST